MFCAHRPTHDLNRGLVKHVNNEKRHLLTFLTTPGAQAINWETEQALRGMIVNRTPWGGDKTRKGADTAAVLASLAGPAPDRSGDTGSILSVSLTQTSSSEVS